MPETVNIHFGYSIKQVTCILQGPPTCLSVGLWAYSTSPLFYFIPAVKIQNKFSP